MKMVKAKIRGLGSTIETQWFELSQRLNLFNFSNRNAGTRFINALQTINPPYSCHGVRPFRDFPNVSKHRGYLRRINPKKRTIAMAVFAATPELVGELARNSDLLYEVDRIEVGRRLDYSRWMNFVELASSTRWSEIAADINHLFHQAVRVAPQLAAELHAIIETTLPSDRVKREIKNSLLALLHDARHELGPEFEQLIYKTRDAVMRVDYFQAARDTVYQRLPLFLALGSSPVHPRSDDLLLQWMSDPARQQNDRRTAAERRFLDDVNHQLSLLDICQTPLQIHNISGTFSVRSARLKSGNAPSSPDEILVNQRETVCLAIALCRAVYRTEPVLLFDSPETLLPETSHPLLVQFIDDISAICQCLYVSPRINIFPKGSAGKVYNEPMLTFKR